MSPGHRRRTPAPAESAPDDDAAERHRSRRVLRRQRRPVRPLLRARLRLPSRRLLGPRDRRCATARRTCSSRDASGWCSAARSAPTPRSRAITRSTATASGRSPCRSPTSITPTTRPYAAAPRASRCPNVVSDEHGQVRRASIATYGDTLHTFIDRSGVRRPVPARLRGARGAHAARPTRCSSAIDHIVGNVELGHMEEWVKFYEDVFGMVELIHFSDEAISTEYSALMSKVVASGNGRIKFPINEPAEGKRKSQIDEYLEFYEGAGAQHIAVATRDIVATVADLRRRGVEFLHDPRRLLRGGAGPGARGRRPARRPAQAGDPRRPRRRGIPAADLHEAGRRPARRCSSRSSSDTEPPASEQATSRPCSRRSSASRRRGGISDALHDPRRRPGQAPRPVPPEREPAGRGGPRLRGLLRQRVDPLPPVVALPRPRGRRLPADPARGVGARRPTSTA